MVGTWQGTGLELDAVIDKLRDKFLGNEYHIFNQNCNCFANELVKALTGKQLPGYVNRLAYMASTVSCLIPENLTNQAPVDDGSQSSGSSSLGFSGGPRKDQRNFTAFKEIPNKLGSATDASTNESASLISKEVVCI